MRKPLILLLVLACIVTTAIPAKASIDYDHYLYIPDILGPLSPSEIDADTLNDFVNTYQSCQYTYGYDFFRWPHAVREVVVQELIAVGFDFPILYGVPALDDLTEAEVESLAREAVYAQYDLPKILINNAEAWSQVFPWTLPQDDTLFHAVIAYDVSGPAPVWIVEISRRYLHLNERPSSYLVRLDADGNLLTIRETRYPYELHLQDPFYWMAYTMDDYVKAIGPIDQLTDAERLIHNIYTLLFPETNMLLYGIPKEDNLTAAQAEANATAALEALGLLTAPSDLRRFKIMI